jgi:hypothetical protein
MGHQRQDINPRGYSKWPLERFVRAAHEGDVELLGKMPLQLQPGFSGNLGNGMIVNMNQYIYMNAYMDESMDESMDEYMEDYG